MAIAESQCRYSPQLMHLTRAKACVAPDGFVGEIIDYVDSVDSIGVCSGRNESRSVEFRPERALYRLRCDRIGNAGQQCRSVGRVMSGLLSSPSGRSASSGQEAPGSEAELHAVIGAWMRPRGLGRCPATVSVDWRQSAARVGLSHASRQPIVTCADSTML